jgi:cytochrome b561
MENQRSQYAVLSRMLHWVMAVIVLTMLTRGV